MRANMNSAEELCYCREGTARWLHRRNTGWILKVKQQKNEYKLRASDSGKETTQTKTRSVNGPERYVYGGENHRTASWLVSVSWGCTANQLHFGEDTENNITAEARELKFRLSSDSKRSLGEASLPCSLPCALPAAGVLTGEQPLCGVPIPPWWRTNPVSGQLPV